MNVFLSDVKLSFHLRIAFCCLFCFPALTLFAGDLKIGASAVRITPPVWIPLDGYYSPRIADAVHNDLYAKAMVIEKDGGKQHTY